MPSTFRPFSLSLYILAALILVPGLAGGCVSCGAHGHRDAKPRAEQAQTPDDGKTPAPQTAPAAGPAVTVAPPPPPPPALATVLPQPLFDPKTAEALQTAYQNDDYAGVLTTLDGFDLSAVSDEIKRRVSFLRSLCLLKLNSPAKAEPLLGALGNSDDVLADYYRYFHAVALAELDRQQEAYDAAALVPADSLWHDEAALLKVRALLALNKQPEGLEQALKIADANDSATALQLAFDAAARLKKNDQAYGIARRLYAGYPRAVDDDAFREMLKRIGKKHIKQHRAEDGLSRGNRYFAAFDYPEALQQYTAALKYVKRKSALWCDLETQTARSWFRRRSYRNSLKIIDPVIAGCKKQTAIHELALHLKGFSLYKLGRGPEGAPILEQQLKLYPKGAWAAASLGLLTDIAFRAKDDAAAQAWARRLAAEFPDDPEATEKLWLSAWTAYSNGLMETAEPLLKEISADADADPIQRQRAVYWLARIQHRAKNTDAAVALYKQALQSHPLSFYGLLAARRLESIDPETYAEATLLPRKKPYPLSWHVPWEELRGARHAFLEDIHLQRGLALLATGMLAGPTAGAEFNAARSDAAGDVQAQWLLSLLLYRAGDHVRGVYIARNAMLDSHYQDAPSDANAPYWLLAFPRPYADLIDVSVALHGRSPRNSAELMLALMREESSFNPTIGSFANALGLTQIIKSTAKQIARELKEKPFNFYDLTIPEVAIRFGTHHLGGLIASFKGRLPLAIASYNAGASRIKGWTKQRGDLPMDEFLESMTIAQPRRYTKRLLRSYAIYRYLYTDQYPVLDISLAPPSDTQ